MPIVWLWLACDGPAVDEVDSGTATAPDCQGYDWDTVGAPFLFTWCTTCHSSTTLERRDAPVGVDLDTLDGARQWAARIEQRAVVERDMPPTGGPFEDEVATFGAWLACGLPE